MYDFSAHNKRTHVQFRLTEAQKAQLTALAPPGLSTHQAAKWLLLKSIDKKGAAEMAERAAEGYTRLST